MSLCSLTSILAKIPELLSIPTDNMSLESIKVKPSVGSSYRIGDPGKEEDMRNFKQLDAKMLAIGQLNEGDCAFVQCSKGYWQYAMVIESPNRDRRIKFKTDTRGQTKTIPFYQWAEYIRLIKTHPSITKHALRRVAYEGFLEEDVYSKPPKYHNRSDSGTLLSQRDLISHLPILIAVVAAPCYATAH